MAEIKNMRFFSKKSLKTSKQWSLASRKRDAAKAGCR